MAERESFLEGLGSRLQAARQHRRLTQRQVGERLGWGLRGNRRLSRYECGEACPDLGTVLELRQVYGVSLDYLLLGRSPGQLRHAQLLARLRAIDELAPARQDELLRLLDAFLTGQKGAGGAAGEATHAGDKGDRR